MQVALANLKADLEKARKQVIKKIITDNYMEIINTYFTMPHPPELKEELLEQHYRGPEFEDVVMSIIQEQKPGLYSKIVMEIEDEQDSASMLEKSMPTDAEKEKWDQMADQANQLVHQVFKESVRSALSDLKTRVTCIQQDFKNMQTRHQQF